MSKQKADKAQPCADFVVCRNPKAQHDYEIEEKLEAGLVLQGSEVKSLRARRADLEGSYAGIDHNELFLHGMHVAPYEQAGAFGHEPKRVRKLLVHRQEIKRLLGKLSLRGYTLVPLSVYFKQGRAKVEIALARGKNLGDKRETEKKRDWDRERARVMREKG